MRDRLNISIRPKYVARVERRVYLEHFDDESDQLRYPNVTVVRGREGWPYASQSNGSALAVAEPDILTLPTPVEKRETFILIKSLPSKDIVAAIEILSPGNKRVGSDGRTSYLEKRGEILASRVHLVELDLFRDGRRLPTVEPLPAGDYYALVSPGNRRPRVEVYHWFLADPMPTISIPLLSPDPPVRLELQAAFAVVFDRAAYEDTLDRKQSLKPPLTRTELKLCKRSRSLNRAKFV